LTTKTFRNIATGNVVVTREIPAYDSLIQSAATKARERLPATKDEVIFNIRAGPGKCRKKFMEPNGEEARAEDLREKKSHLSDAIGPWENAR